MQPAQASRRWWQWAGLAVILLLGLHAARNALIEAEGSRRPALAAMLWPGHPAPAFNLALAGIGAAAARGREPSPELLALVEQGARSAPLAVEPLLVAAAARLARGDTLAGERLLVGAIARQPRAPAARFLLADLLVRQNRIPEAMQQLTALDRRIGMVSGNFAPAVAAYLREPGAVATMRPVLADNPRLRRAVMAQLAAEEGGEGLLLALARRGDAAEPWLGTALSRLLAAGAVGPARQLLARSGSQASGRALAAWSPGPSAAYFGWRFPASGGGVAEPALNGPLRLVYYGRDETLLADHPLMLPPGRYRLSQTLSGAASAGAFEWRLACIGKAQAVVMRQALPDGAGQTDFTVPADCPAQALQLHGRPGDFPRTISTDLSAVTLAPASAPASESAR